MVMCRSGGVMEQRCDKNGVLGQGSRVQNLV